MCAFISRLLWLRTRRIRLIVFTAAVTIGCNSTPPPAATKATAAPAALICDKPSINLGERRQAVTVKAEFRIRNTSKIALTVDKIQASCSCMVPNWQHRNFAPGQTDLLRIEFPTASYQGVLTRDAKIIAHEDLRPDRMHFLDVAMRVIVQPDLLVEPGAVDFGVLTGDRPVTAEISVQTVAMEQPVAILDAETSHRALLVRGPSSAPAGESSTRAQRLTVTLDPRSHNTESLSAQLRIRTNSAAMQYLEIPVRATIKRPYHLDRDAVMFILDRQSDRPQTEQINVSTDPAAPPTAIVASCADPAFNVKVLPGKAPRETVIRISVDPKAVRKSHEGLLAVSAGGRSARLLPLRLLDIRE